MKSIRLRRVSHAVLSSPAPWSATWSARPASSPSAFSTKKKGVVTLVLHEGGDDQAGMLDRGNGEEVG